MSGWAQDGGLCPLPWTERPERSPEADDFLSASQTVQQKLSSIDAITQSLLNSNRSHRRTKLFDSKWVALTQFREKSRIAQRCRSNAIQLSRRFVPEAAHLHQVCRFAAEYARLANCVSHAIAKTQNAVDGKHRATCT